LKGHKTHEIKKVAIYFIINWIQG